LQRNSLENSFVWKKSFWVQKDLQSSYKEMLVTLLRAFWPIHVKILCTCLSQRPLDAVNVQYEKNLKFLIVVSLCMASQCKNALWNKL
jgi:hypothetical protein